MNILLVNDDGIRSKGLHLAADALAEFGDVYIVVPDRNRSASGHSITLSWPITYNPHESIKSCFECSGTPADCTKLGIREIMKGIEPDLVVVGINPGANTGASVLYSGTVAAASEAAIIGLPAMAISIAEPEPRFYDGAVDFIKRVVPMIHKNGLPDWTILNVNVPDLPLSEIKGSKIVPQGLTFYNDYFKQYTDDYGRNFHWMVGDIESRDRRSEIDKTVVEGGYISVTPLRVDRTDYDAMDSIKGWNL